LEELEMSDQQDNSDSRQESKVGEADAQTPPRRLSEETAAPLDEAKAEAEKFKNEYLYLRAEFENFKKQTIKERSDLRKYGSERLAADLLNVLDIFETALSTEVTAETVQNFRKGIEMTATELRSVLNRHGVSEIPSKGQVFDPALHEALSSEETNESAPGTITQVFKKAYKLHDRVIRPGQVVVAKAKS
jgi:molecular chaperone GrpE